MVPRGVPILPLSLTLPLNGEPVDAEVLDTFAYEVHARFRRR